jgi:hypothetical protein
MGPTVAILLPPDQRAPSPEGLLEIAHSLDASAETSTDVSITTTLPVGGASQSCEGGRPFGFHVGTTGFAAAQLEPVAFAFGFTPEAAIHAFGYANASIDHRMLADLALFFARMFNGIVDFGGNLGHVTTRAGKLISVPYSPGSFPSAFHVSDADFLRAWMGDPAFHMIK